MSREGFLESIPLFSSLQTDELRDILLMARPFSFRAGDLVFDQGVEADGMYVLEQGRVQLWCRLLGDDEVALGQIGAGGVLGEFSLIDRGARSASAEVIEPTQGYFFSNRQFELLRADRRPAALKTMRQLCAILCERLRRTKQELGQCPAAFYQRPQPVVPTARRPELAISAPAADELDPQRLRALPFFNLFSVAELRELLAPLSVWSAPRGHLLFAEGEAASAAFVTVRGAVEIVAGGPESGRRVAILGPGRPFGLVSLLDGGTRSSTSVVRENAMVLEIPPAEMDALLRAETVVGYKFSDAVHHTLIDSLRSANRTLLCQSAMGRVSRRKKRATGPQTR